jgi:hypothetical protein
MQGGGGVDSEAGKGYLSGREVSGESLFGTREAHP